MKITTLMTASVAALLASTSAQAQISGSLGGGADPFVSLSAAGLGGGSIATLSGGTIYTADQPFADIPAGGIYGNTFLAAGPTSGSTATLTFTPGTGWVSFLWGSPDTYNALTITSSLGNVASFTASGLGFSVTNGNQSFSQYVQFQALGVGEYIKSISFSNVPSQDAFEVANFAVRGVPEASTWAMMVLGVGAAGGMMRRRRIRTSVSFA
ncbi:PEP-CTERM sorting domain-containing protein [Sphingomonas sp. JC676]|uniref:Npun_F0296 family exosortase-dependent surface protein n=1 Tax=Sphingomonas sp. JC676 TaxID=2768065 RepID=UPI001657A1F5|nr:PEP-CTERM sorting domain-containing protein [Sphingomonas sp. JC676]MBC9032786.1 PEP-CTERM sorting domain-containing protein [Sphingomonas sp. JC676]